MKTYFYKLLHKYLSVYVRPQNSLLEIHPASDLLIRLFCNLKTAVLLAPGTRRPDNLEALSRIEQVRDWNPEYILLNGNIHYEEDIQAFMESLHTVCQPSTRLLITYYSALWKPLTLLATALGLRTRTGEQNWVTHTDIDNLLQLAGFQTIRRDQRILIPLYIPFLSYFINRYVAPLWFFRHLAMINILIARPMALVQEPRPLSVSVVVPARNEAGNIESAITRLPPMGPDDELIFVEGNSTDQTWQTIREMKEKYAGRLSIQIAKQEGKGKGDAVRKGFSIATKDILMILDADLTVPPEALPKFHRALVSGAGELISGSRLVYPMEKRAMRFWNMVGNKFFAMSFSFVLGQQFKDTLCGTKVISRENYIRLAAQRSFFGDFDPFGDFDLLFGSCRMGLKLCEIPIRYAERTYGTTNIQRWRHGLILLRMLLFAALKIKFI
jgi:hypothetical protein